MFRFLVKAGGTGIIVHVAVEIDVAGGRSPRPFDAHDRDVRLQQIQIAWVRQYRNCALYSVLDCTQLYQIPGDRGCLIEMINILRRPRRIDRHGERFGAADAGDILFDAPQFGLVTSQGAIASFCHAPPQGKGVTTAPPNRGNAAETPCRSLADWEAFSARSERPSKGPGRSTARHGIFSR